MGRAVGSGRVDQEGQKLLRSVPVQGLISNTNTSKRMAKISKVEEDYLTSNLTLCWMGEIGQRKLQCLKCYQMNTHFILFSGRGKFTSFRSHFSIKGVYSQGRP